MSKTVRRSWQTFLSRFDIWRRQEIIEGTRAYRIQGDALKSQGFNLWYHGGQMGRNVRQIGKLDSLDYYDDYSRKKDLKYASKKAVRRQHRIENQKRKDKSK